MPQGIMGVVGNPGHINMLRAAMVVMIAEGEGRDGEEGRGEQRRLR